MTTQVQFPRINRTATVAVVTAIVVLAVVISPKLIALYWLSFGRDFFEALFYDTVGFSKAISSALAVVFSFGYAFACAYLFGWWPYRFLAWRFEARHVVAGLACYVVVYATPDLISAASQAVGPTVCFSQKDGKPIKWYVVEEDGRIVLHDSAGFDRLGNEKKIATAEICRAYDRQQGGRRPNRVTTDPGRIEYFDTVTNLPKIWFRRAPDGSIELFDAPGFHPVTREALSAITPEIAAELRKRAEIEVLERQAMAVKVRREQENKSKLNTALQRSLSENETAIANRAEANQRQAALRFVASAIRASRSGYECGLNETGLWFKHPRTGERRHVSFAKLRVAVHLANFRSPRNPAASAVVRGLSVSAMASNERPIPTRCVIHAARAPLELKDFDWSQHDRLLGALQTLGATVVSQRPRTLHVTEQSIPGPR